MARVRIYRSRDESSGAVWHIFGLLPTSLAVMADGGVRVWNSNVEEYCDPDNGWDLVHEGDAS